MASVAVEKGAEKIKAAERARIMEEVVGPLVEALESCEQVLCEVTCTGDFDALSDQVRELSDKELGRLWISVGRQVQAALAKAREQMVE